MLRCGRSGSFLGFAPEETSELHRSVNGFRAAVRKKDAVHPGPSGESARERTLIGIVIEIREVNRAGGFAANYFHDARKRVPDVAVFAGPSLGLRTERVRGFRLDGVPIMPPKEPLARQTKVHGGRVF